MPRCGCKSQVLGAVTYRNDHFPVQLNSQRSISYQSWTYQRHTMVSRAAGRCHFGPRAGHAISAVLSFEYLSSRLGQTMKATLLPRRVLKPTAFSHIGGVTPFLPIATNFAFGASGVITANTFWPAASIARSVGSNRTIGVPTGTKTLDVPPL